MWLPGEELWKHLYKLQGGGCLVYVKNSKASMAEVKWEMGEKIRKSTWGQVIKGLVSKTYIALYSE